MSWTLVNTAPNSIREGQFLCDTTNNNLIYVDYPDQKVYSWNGAAETEILDYSALLGSIGYEKLAFFQSHVYFAASGTSGPNTVARVWRYDGTPGVWTLVDSVVLGWAGATLGDMRARYDDSFLFTVLSDNTLPNRIRASANGSAWGWEAASASFENVDAGLVPMYGTEMYAHGGIVSGAPFNRWFFARSTGWAISGVELTALNLVARIHYGAGFNALYTRISTTGHIYRSDDGSASWDDTGLTIGGTDLVFSAGNFDFVPSSIAGRLYYWTGGAWVQVDLNAGGTTIGLCRRGTNLYVVVNNKEIYVNDTFIFGGNIPKRNSTMFPLSMAADKDDAYLYVASLEGTTPVLLKLVSDLSAAPTEAFKPGIGTSIGVHTGIQDSDVVWVGGDFSTSELQRSVNAGTSWAAANPGWGSAVMAFVIGTDVDTRVEALLLDNSAEGTVDSGTTWTEHNADIGIHPSAMDKLDVNLDEAVVGAYLTEPGLARVLYTPDNFQSLGDITGALPVDTFVTDVIVG